MLSLICLIVCTTGFGWCAAFWVIAKIQDRPSGIYALCVCATIPGVVLSAARLTQLVP